MASFAAGMEAHAYAAGAGGRQRVPSQRRRAAARPGPHPASALGHVPVRRETPPACARRIGRAPTPDGMSTALAEERPAPSTASVPACPGARAGASARAAPARPRTALPLAADSGGSDGAAASHARKSRGRARTTWPHHPSRLCPPHMNQTLKSDGAAPLRSARKAPALPGVVRAACSMGRRGRSGCGRRAGAFPCARRPCGRPDRALSRWVQHAGRPRTGMRLAGTHGPSWREEPPGIGRHRRNFPSPPATAFLA